MTIVGHVKRIHECIERNSEPGIVIDPFHAVRGQCDTYEIDNASMDVNQPGQQKLNAEAIESGGLEQGRRSHNCELPRASKDTYSVRQLRAQIIQSLQAQ